MKKIKIPRITELGLVLTSEEMKQIVGNEDDSVLNCKCTLYLTMGDPIRYKPTHKKDSSACKSSCDSICKTYTNCYTNTAFFKPEGFGSGAGSGA